MMLLIIIFLIETASATSPCLPRPICKGAEEPLTPIECGPNAHFERCPQECSDVCPPTICPCIEKDCCRPRCVCDDGYLRDEQTGICIKAEDCRYQCPSKCRPTCAVPNPPNCPSNPYNASNPCLCKKGYILSETGGKCIKISECPINLGCNGDPNASVQECPLACPSTCARPNAILCRSPCKPIGCACKPGYILSENNGKCILPDKCPDGNPCGKNENFVSCKVPCPSDYCPDQDILRYPVCDSPSPCLSGCVCKHNHKRKSKKDPSCILAECCTPITCTRPNEEWNPCRPFCPRMNCREAGNFCSEPFVRTCEPRCTCFKDYFRNDTDICIPSKKCPKPV